MSQDEHESPAEPLGADVGLSEAQIAAIEQAFAEHDRKLARLSRELEELRSRPLGAQQVDTAGDSITDRLAAIEARVDQHDQALRHILQRLILFFERARPG